MDDGDKVFFFTAPWCGPCKLVAKKVKEVAEGLGVEIRIIDVEEAPNLARFYEVDHLPSVIWTRGGESVTRQVGAVTRSQLLSAGVKFKQDRDSKNQ